MPGGRGQMNVFLWCVYVWEAPNTREIASSSTTRIEWIAKLIKKDSLYEVA